MNLLGNLFDLKYEIKRFLYPKKKVKEEEKKVNKTNT